MRRRHTAVRRALAALCALPLATLGACAGDDDESILDKEELVIGLRYDLPRVSLQTDEGFEGYEADVARFLAEQLGKDAEFVPIDLDEREPMLLSGEIDLAVATYSITQERKQTIDFAGPYVVEHFDILVRADNTRITELEHLAGETVCELEGSNAIDRLTKEHGIRAHVREVQSYDDCVGLLGTGEIDAIATDEFVLAGLAEAADFETRLAGARFSQERIGIGMREGDTAGCEALNRVITEMYAEGPSGGDSHATLLLEKWFEGTVVDPSQIPIPQFEGCA
ncbi:type 2 periplasmic-binding domain-containing protein [Glycomyces tarimensis]